MEFTSAFHLKSANPVLFKNGSDPTQAEQYGRATALLVGLSWPQIAGTPPSLPGPTRESPLSWDTWDTGQENQPYPLTRLAPHTRGETGVKSFVHNLLLDQGLLHSSSSFTEINWQSPLDTKHYNKNRRERKRKEGRKGGRKRGKARKIQSCLSLIHGPGVGPDGPGNLHFQVPTTWFRCHLGLSVCWGLQLAEHLLSLNAGQG